MSTITNLESATPSSNLLVGRSASFILYQILAQKDYWQCPPSMQISRTIKSNISFRVRKEVSKWLIKKIPTSMPLATQYNFWELDCVSMSNKSCVMQLFVISYPAPKEWTSCVKAHCAVWLQHLLLMVDTKRHQDHNGCCPIPYKHFEAVIILDAVNSEGDFMFVEQRF